MIQTTKHRGEYIAAFGGPNAIGGTAVIYKLNAAEDYSFFCMGISMADAKKVIRALEEYRGE